MVVLFSVKHTLDIQIACMYLVSPLELIFSNYLKYKSQIKTKHFRNAKYPHVIFLAIFPTLSVIHTYDQFEENAKWVPT